jgi:hypothetical protein
MIERKSILDKKVALLIGISVVLAFSLFNNIQFLGYLNMQTSDLRAMGQYVLSLEKYVQTLEHALDAYMNPKAAMSGVRYPTANMEVVQIRNGFVVGYWVHAATLTNIGKDFYEGKMYNPSFTNTTSYAQYIGCSDDAGVVSATNRQLAAEIATNGLQRAAGTYASTGTGTCNQTRTFTATNAQTVQKNSASLAWTDTSAQKSLASGDTLRVTFMITDS